MVVMAETNAGLSADVVSVSTVQEQDVAILQSEGRDIRLHLAGPAGDDIGQHVPLGVMAHVLDCDPTGFGQRLGHVGRRDVHRQ